MNLKCNVFGRGDSYRIRMLPYVMSARHFWKLRHNFDNQYIQYLYFLNKYIKCNFRG